MSLGAAARGSGAPATVRPDGRRLRRRRSTTGRCTTPAGAPLVVPTAALAAAIAAEWDALEAEIEPDRLPLTRAANSAIDRVAPQREAVVDADRRLRRHRPALLPRRRAGRRWPRARPTGWDPWLAWAARALARAAGRGDRRDAPAAAGAEPRRAARGGRRRGRLRARPRCTSSSRSRARWCSGSPWPAGRSTPPRPGSCRASTRPGRPSNGASTPRPRRPPPRRRGRLPARGRAARPCSERDAPTRQAVNRNWPRISAIPARDPVAPLAAA